MVAVAEVLELLAVHPPPVLVALGVTVFLVLLRVLLLLAPVAVEVAVQRRLVPVALEVEALEPKAERLVLGLLIPVAAVVALTVAGRLLALVVPVLLS
jgi:hypothetical protein